MDTIPSFAALLKEQRALLGVSQQALADAVHASREMIKQIEGGRNRPGEQLAGLLADQFALTGDERAAFIAAARNAAPVSARSRPGRHQTRPMPPPRPAALPTLPTAIIDREADVAAVARILAQPAVRLVTLTGPPGIGKTRLALAVAAAAFQQGRYPGGVVFVPLAPLRDPDLVLPTIAQHLRADMSSLVPESALASVLGGGRRLLVLDNFEQVLDAATAVAALLSTAPDLQVLVTSREMLHIYGEHEFPVPPLAVPGAGDPVPIPVLRQVPAVALFIHRAQAARADFALTEENAPAVAALCVHLEGLPLAIELAAARSKLFSPAAMLTRLEQRLTFLTGGPRDLPARQQTLRGAIDWSYELLDPAEQTLLRRLAVFRGGGTEAAAAAVGALPTVTPLDTLNALASLVDKSLLRQWEVPETGALRFGMLETIRAYAWERLGQEEDRAGVQRRHALYYIALAETPQLLPDGSIALAWLQQLAQEHDNLRAVLDWSVASEETDLAVRLSTAVWESGLGITIGAYSVASWLRA